MTVLSKWAGCRGICRNTNSSNCSDAGFDFDGADSSADSNADNTVGSTADNSVGGIADSSAGNKIGSGGNSKYG